MSCTLAICCWMWPPECPDCWPCVAECDLSNVLVIGRVLLKVTSRMSWSLAICCWMWLLKCPGNWLYVAQCDFLNVLVAGRVLLNVASQMSWSLAMYFCELLHVLFHQIPETTYLIVDLNLLLICMKVFALVILICFMCGRFLLICASPIGYDI